jgi:hypothetical protein
MQAARKTDPKPQNKSSETTSFLWHITENQKTIEAEKRKIAPH